MAARRTQPRRTSAMVRVVAGRDVMKIVIIIPAKPGSNLYGDCTVAVACPYCDGVLKPAGVTTVMVDVPTVAGRKLVESLASPGLKTTGLAVIVPTPGAELITGTLIAPRPG